MRKEINSNSENRYYKDQHCGYPNTSLPTKTILISLLSCQTQKKFQL